MNGETHRQLANFIWNTCNLLRGLYKRNAYRKVILPLTVLRRFECLLAPTRQAALAEWESLKHQDEQVREERLRALTGHCFYNLSPMQFRPRGEGISSLLDEPEHVASRLNLYIEGFSSNVRAILDRFKFAEQIAFMAEKNILFEIIQAFAQVDLASERVDSIQMGYVFEELIRIGAEQSNEEAGEHFTPREVIKLIVNLLLSSEQGLGKGSKVKSIYDPACGTGGMLAVAEAYMRQLNSESRPQVFGQDCNDEAWAVCKADTLIKGNDADTIILGDSFTQDGFARDADGKAWTFDYMLANPPFGVEWKQQQKPILREAETLGFAGRFGAGTPRINDGALLFLQHMLAKMRPVEEGGSRIGIVFSGSPLFTGDAGGGESNIRQWIMENDWLEAVVSLPEQLFYNTGIGTYIWILSNHKEARRKGKVQLIDARNFWVPMEKSLGNKRRRIGDPEDKAKDPDHISAITRIYQNFQNGETCPFPIQGQKQAIVVSRIFENADFAYRKICIERPLRLNFQASAERIARLDEQPGFRHPGSSKQDLVPRQQLIRGFLGSFAEIHGAKLYRDRRDFLRDLQAIDRRQGIKLSAAEIKAIQTALGERDENAEVCTDKAGQAEPDPDLRDSENVGLKESLESYFEREVVPFAKDAWFDPDRTKLGYEIHFNRHFHRYEPPRPLQTIEAEIKALETEIIAMLRGTGGQA